MSGGLDARSKAELARLQRAGPVITRRLQRALRTAGKDAARKAQNRIREAASHHPGTLREEIAATVAVRSSVRRDGAGLVITSSGAKMPPGKESLPGYANASPPWNRWRHPVYGNRRVWRTQTWVTARGWFGDTLYGQREDIARQLQDALDSAGRDLGGG